MKGSMARYRARTNLHFKPTLKRSRLSSSFRLYDLRHACATLLLSANVHPKVVSESLRWVMAPRQQWGGHTGVEPLPSGRPSSSPRLRPQ